MRERRTPPTVEFKPKALAGLSLALFSTAAATWQGAELISNFRSLGTAYDLQEPETEFIEWVNRSISRPFCDIACRSLRSCEVTSPCVEEARVLHSMGVAYSAIGSSEKSIDYFSQAFHFWRAAGDAKGEGEALSWLGTELYRSGDVEQAILYKRRALDLYQRLGDGEGEVRTLLALGEAFVRSGRPREAAQFLQRAVQSSPSHSEYNVRIKLGLGRAKELQGRVREASELYSEALALSRGSGGRQEEAVALAGLSRTKQRAGYLGQAAILAQLALQALESPRSNLTAHSPQASYLVSPREIYSTKIDILMELQQQMPEGRYAEEAFMVTERFRAGWAAEFLRTYTLDEPEPAPKAKYLKHIDSLLKRQKSYSNRIEELEGDLKEVLGKLERSEMRARTSVTFAEYAGALEPLTVGKIQSSILDDETYLLSYWLGEKKSYVWVISRNSIEVRELPPAQHIDKLATQAHELLSRSYGKIALRSVDGPLERLSRMILSPVAGYIADAKRLVVITDGSLQSIPFSALPHPATKGDVLIDRYEIVLLPSATVIDRLRTQEPSRPKPSRQIAVVADPIFSTDDPRVNQAHGRRATSRVSRKIDLPRFTRLPYSGQEAESISALWPEDEVLTAVGYEANLEAVTENRLSGYRIIHFATHGMIDDDRPELSSIVLSLVDKDGRPENGLLRASDIKDLSLSADLVVLSACSTALGYEHRGEGLGNLTRSFMSAGVPRVVASLWSVDDRATAELMSHFYRSLLLKGSSPATALREAQLFLRHDPRWSAPVYWAGFVLQGDWRSIDLQVKYAEARSAIAAETESVNTSKSELPDPISE